MPDPEDMTLHHARAVLADMAGRSDAEIAAAARTVLAESDDQQEQRAAGFALGIAEGGA